MAEEYCVIRGFDLERGKTHQEKVTLVEKVIKAEWEESIQVKGLFESVPQGVFQLSHTSPLCLLRLYSDIPNVFTKPITTLKKGATIHRIEEELKDAVFCKLNLKFLEYTPCSVSHLKGLQKDTGVCVGVDSAGDYWLHGMWFQVAIARKVIETSYAENRVDQVHDLNPSLSSAINMNALESLLNGKSQLSTSLGKSAAKAQKAQFYDVALFCSAFLAIPKLQGEETETQIVKHLDIHKIEIQTATKKFMDMINEQYKEVSKLKEKLTIPPMFPVSYQNMVQTVLQSKARPSLIVRINSGINTYLVYDKSQLPAMERFLEEFLQTTAPGHACGIEGLKDISQFLPIVPSLTLEEGDEAKIRVAVKQLSTHTYTGVFVKSEDEMLYLKQEHSKDIEKICLGFQTKLDGDQILLGHKEQPCVTTCLKQLEKFYGWLEIETKEMSWTGDKLPADVHLFIRKIDSKTISVTGQRSAMLKLEESASSAKPRPRSDRKSDSKEKSSAKDRQSHGKETPAKPTYMEPVATSTSEHHYIPMSGKTHPRTERSVPMDTYEPVDLNNNFFYNHKYGAEVEIGSGDITNLHLDAIVNSTNRNLDHEAGLSSVIFKAAGKVMADECAQILQQRTLKPGDVCITTAGNMPADNVIHAVLPVYHGNTNSVDACTQLQTTFYSCLKEAQAKKCLTIGIPPLGAGNHGFPKDDVAKCACTAVQQFLGNRSNTGLKHIRFIDIHQENLDALKRQMDKLVDGGDEFVKA